MEIISLRKVEGDERPRPDAFVDFVALMEQFPSAAVIFWLEGFYDEELYEHADLLRAVELLGNVTRPSVEFHLDAGEVPDCVRAVVADLARLGKVPSMSTDDGEFFQELIKTPSVLLPSVALIKNIEIENYETDLLKDALTVFISTNTSSELIRINSLTYFANEVDVDHTEARRFVQWVLDDLPGSYQLCELV